MFSFAYFEYEFINVVGSGVVAEHLTKCAKLSIEFWFLYNNTISNGIGDA